MLWEEDDGFSKICVFDDIMAFCRSEAVRAMTLLPVQGTGKQRKMIEVGLIGFGLAGRAFHTLVIRAVPGLHLAAILQRSGAEAAELYPDVRIVRSMNELLAIPEIRLVVIATPNETHYPLARQCL